MDFFIFLFYRHCLLTKSFVYVIVLALSFQRSFPPKLIWCWMAFYRLINCEIMWHQLQSYLFQYY